MQRIGVRQGRWTKVAVAVPPIEPGITFVPVRHCAEVLPCMTRPQAPGTAAAGVPALAASNVAPQQLLAEQLVLVGGGAFCFSFGSTFSRVYSLDLGAVEEQLHAHSNAAGDVQVAAGHMQATVSKSGAGVRSGTGAKSGTGAGAAGGSTGSSSCWVLAVQARSAKAVKDALKAAGWLDCSKKAGEVGRLQQQGHVGHSKHAAGGAATGGRSGRSASAGASPVPVVLLPLMPAAVDPLTAAAQALLQAGSAAAASQLSQLPAAVWDALKDGVASLSQAETAANPKHNVSPQQAMVAAVKALMKPGLDQATVDQLLADLPGEAGCALVLSGIDFLYDATGA